MQKWLKTIGAFDIFAYLQKNKTIKKAINRLIDTYRFLLPTKLYERLKRPIVLVIFSVLAIPVLKS